MKRTVSVVIPVKDGARWLDEVLRAVAAQQPPPDEVLVIDSGSNDGSLAIARAAGVEVLQIAPEEFGHGRTRNLGVERTTGELICFLTQDATPLPGWLDAFREAFDLEPRIGASFGPHLPRPDTSPMIARELTEFFGSFSADGRPAIHRTGDPPFLSNVNACYLRACWSAIRFDDVHYAEDQAFGRAMLAAGWAKVYHPRAAVLHAHDYGPAGFMRRYFDEYRGLRETTGHVERIGVRSTARYVRDSVTRDRRWMAEQGWPAPRVAAWTARAAVHHGGRRLFSSLGSHASKLPPVLQQAISLEGRALGDQQSVAGPVAATPRPPGRPHPHAPVLEVARSGAVPLVDPVPGMAQRDRLHIAVVIPPFRRGSGGHSTIYNLLTRLEQRGHTVSTWLHDPLGYHRDEWPAVVRHELREFFRPIEGPVHKGFDGWYGADVVLATGWDTVFPALRLGKTRARVYLVQDHEPEFFATSADSLFAEQSYRQGLHVIAASRWLLELVRGRYGAEGTWFDLGVDHEIYRPHPVARSGDTVIFYARDVTPRRAVGLGLLALAELHRRRPHTRFVLFGDHTPVEAPFPYDHLGIAAPEALSWAYSEAAVGLSLSLTNYSLIPQEMMACGLPCVELAGRSAENEFGADGPLAFAPADPVGIADVLERLLDDPRERERRSAAGLEFVAGRTWEHAADQLEAGLRAALRRREEGLDGIGDGTPLANTLDRRPASSDDARTVPVDGPVGSEATDRLYERLEPADVEAVLAALPDDERRMVDSYPESSRRELILIHGTRLEIPGVLQRTGLRADQPPDDVHAMARGPLAAAGSLYDANLVAESLGRAGLSMEGIRRGLDFGCSSGRITRVLAAAWPDIEWFGADPNARAIEWAAEHLPEIGFVASPQEPPLPYAAETFDLVTAISIWSHYGEAAATGWLREMARLIAPGGALVLTTHGLHSVSFYARTGERSPDQLADIRRALFRRGYWYLPEFGESGDWGVSHPQWGTAFFTPEWLARQSLRDFLIADYRVGGNLDNQDVYVLVRRASPQP